ncbi:sterile alpha motif domain-containing protein 3-like isoform X2 [Dicentrarchus labrax]|uniref:sterile alpha motif domain-containing protein 3-like isoform X2 n=1 Tax=Dicentrarchus labrax TaxID=13489 RepID=UPI0021F60517|nr:sterile alpha motif domain-containing protein 3-like isoform X2 [Dicentrarchus labrax]
MSMKDLSTEEVLQKLEEFGLNVTEEEAQRFRDNEVDGETLEYGLTDNMVSYLFPGSFKKQVKFNKFIQELKDVVTLTLEQVPEECIEQPSTIESEANRRLPAGFIVPPFPRDLQTRLDNKEACLKLSRDRHRIIRVLHEAIIEYTMYPTNAEYVQVVKALIVKYPVLKDLEGNGYHTWHQSLKRKFKAERAPLVHEDEVRRSKEKFGHKRARQSTEAARTYCRSVPGVPAIIGEDASSIGRHVNILRVQYERMQPDNSIVKDCMQRTFAWRRREIADGMTVEDILKKYPFLRTPSGLYDEVDRIHPSSVNLCRRLKEGFTSVVPKVLKLAQGKTPLAKIYVEAREEMLVEDLQDVDFRAALILLPYIFKEKVDQFITLGQCDAESPYPTVQLVDNNWKIAFTRKVPVSVRVDGVDLCRGAGVEEGVIAAFCAYFVFNLAYPPYMKNTLTFLQRTMNITVVGEKSLPVTVTRMINILY